MTEDRTVEFKSNNRVSLKKRESLLKLKQLELSYLEQKINEYQKLINSNK